MTNKEAKTVIRAYLEGRMVGEADLKMAVRCALAWIDRLERVGALSTEVMACFVDALPERPNKKQAALIQSGHVTLKIANQIISGEIDP